MNKVIILLLALTIGIQATITFDSALHCSCSELLESDCNELSSYCKWITTTSPASCSDYVFTCDSQTQANCTEVYTSYKCGWENNTCTEKSYSCSNYTTSEKCPKSVNLYCYWNKSGKCESSFSSCADYDKDNCPYSKSCILKNGICSDYTPTYVTCSDYTIQNACDNAGSDSSTTKCRWATSNICKSYSYDFTCTDLSDFQAECKDRSACKLVDGTCNFQQCSDKTKSYCYTAQTGKTEFTLCSLVNEVCSDALDATSLTAYNCLQRSKNNYKWTGTGCVECSDLVSDISYGQFVYATLLLIVLLAFI